MWSSEISPLIPRKEYSFIGANSDRPLSSKAPGIDTAKAVDPNLRAMFQSMAFQSSPVFKTLWTKWIIAVRPIAIGKGKNMAITGMRIVPNPNPEKKEMNEAKNVEIVINKYSRIIYRPLGLLASSS